MFVLAVRKIRLIPSQGGRIAMAFGLWKGPWQKGILIFYEYNTLLALCYTANLFNVKFCLITH